MRRFASDYCDIFLSGTQKWLRAYLPLSVACSARTQSHELINDTIRQCRHDGLLEDPLLDFSRAVGQYDFQAFGETVNVTPLITAAAALDQATRSRRRIADRWERRLANARPFIDIVTPCQWDHFDVCSTMRTGAVLVQANSRDTRSAPPQQLRSHFHRKRVCLSTYCHGMVGVSMPSVPFTEQATSTVRKAFSHL